ncbi:MAG: hypothetical protein HYT50_01680 [Candidatus Wildermuthbacteria bacterium]|nr:hypothetical protein [Candidatus Wildermuthbacteria bacterium]
MKILVITALIFSFIGIAGFAALSMSHASEGHEARCIAAAARGIDCPREVTPFGFASFHIGTFKGFSLATVLEGIAIMFLFALAYAFARISLVFLAAPPRLNSHAYCAQESFFTPQEQKLARWLALHKNSPTDSIKAR